MTGQQGREESVGRFVRLSLFLFGKPAWETEELEGGDVDMAMLEEIKACGEDMRARLARAAAIGGALLNSGWDGYGLLYGIDFCKETTLKEAEAELRRLGIEPDEISIGEEAEEDAIAEPEASDA